MAGVRRGPIAIPIFKFSKNPKFPNHPPEPSVSSLTWVPFYPPRRGPDLAWRLISHLDSEYSVNVYYLHLVSSESPAANERAFEPRHHRVNATLGCNHEMRKSLRWRQIRLHSTDGLPGHRARCRRRIVALRSAEQLEPAQGTAARSAPRRLTGRAQRS